MGLAQDADVRRGAGTGGVVGLRGLHERHVVIQVELLHHEVLTLVHVHSALVDLSECAGGIDGAQQAAVADVDDHHLGTCAAADRDGHLRVRCGKPAAGTLAQQALLAHLLHHVVGAEVVDVLRGQRALQRRVVQVAAQDVRVRRVEHAALHRASQQRLGVMHQEGIHRLIAGNQHHQRALPATPSPARLLSKRRHRTRIARHHHSVEPADVDTQLERVRRGHAQDVALVQGALQRTTVLRQIARPIRRDPPRKIRPPRSAQILLRAHRHNLRSRPRAHKRQSPRPLTHQPPHYRRRLRRRRVPHRGAVLTLRALDETRLPQHHGALTRRRRIHIHRPHRPATQQLRVLRRSRRRRRRKHQRRLRTVRAGEAKQASKNEGHIGAEHPSIGV